MHILLIGAGYVGTALISSWEGSTFSTITTRQHTEIHSSVQHTHILRIQQKTDLTPFINDCDAVVVTIAPTGGANYEETYVHAAEAIMRAVNARKQPLFLLYTSSTSVYGDHKGAIVSETSERIHSTTNALCAAEDLFLSCNNPSVTTCILRLGGIYGPSRTLEKRARHFSEKELPGSGEEITNHIHLEDITRAIAYCTEQRKEGVYNLINDSHPSRNELYGTLCNQLNIPPPTWNPVLPSKRTTNALVSNKKIKQAGFCFQHSELQKIPDLSTCTHLKSVPTLDRARERD